MQVLGQRFTLADVSVQGITDVTLEQVQAAAAEGCVLRLVARSTRVHESGAAEARYKLQVWVVSIPVLVVIVAVFLIEEVFVLSA